jgi:hypothetical protein
VFNARLNLRACIGPEFADWDNAGFILPAQRQMKDQVAIAGNAEFFQLGLYTLADSERKYLR